jgi:hypothetical protein
VSDGPWPHDEIKLDDYSYLMHGYPSNYIKIIGYLLRTNPDLLPYKYKGVRPIENLEHIPIEPIILFIIPALGVDVA